MYSPCFGARQLVRADSTRGFHGDALAVSADRYVWLVAYDSSGGGNLPLTIWRRRFRYNSESQNFAGHINYCNYLSQHICLYKNLIVDPCSQLKKPEGSKVDL